MWRKSSDLRLVASFVSGLRGRGCAGGFVIVRIKKGKRLKKASALIVVSKPEIWYD